MKSALNFISRKLLDKANILPGTFDGERQGKRSLSMKNDLTEYDQSGEYDLINFIKV